MSHTKAYRSRPRLLAIMTLIIMAIFVLRLFYLQVIRHDYYVTQANSEQLKQLKIPAKRGEIYALDNGKPVKIVLNETVYTVFADPKIIDEPTKIVNVMERIAGGNLRDNIAELIKKKDSRYQIIATKVTRKQAERIKKESLLGIGFQESTQRVYPEGQLAAQTLGFVGPSGKGQYGIEGEHDAQLNGTDGLLQSVTDVRNVPLTIGDQYINTPAKNGDNIVLTLDRNIQAYTEQALQRGLKKSGATDGSVMVMDPRSGKIMAMANFPTYQPHEYYKVNDIAAFNNGTISTPYEAGSVIKTLTLATGIDKNVITPQSTYLNTDKVVVGGELIKNATLGQTGSITMQHALNYSLNTGMVAVARKLGNGQEITDGARQTMYSYFYEKFGLGAKTGIELAGEASGIVVPPTDVQGNAVRYSNMSFGQGMDVTMVQVCAAFSAVVNGGTAYQPTVIEGTMSEGGTLQSNSLKTSKQQVIKSETSKQVRDMVHKARNAFYSGQDKKGYYIGGKTGTSQTIENGVYVDDQTIGSYLGFGGAKNEIPKYVIMVQVSGKNMNLVGNTDAMPIFTDISNWMLDYLKVQPKG